MKDNTILLVAGGLAAYLFLSNKSQTQDASPGGIGINLGGLGGGGNLNDLMQPISELAGTLTGQVTKSLAETVTGMGKQTVGDFMTQIGDQIRGLIPTLPPSSGQTTPKQTAGVTPAGTTTNKAPATEKSANDLWAAGSEVRTHLASETIGIGGGILASQLLPRLLGAATARIVPRGVLAAVPGIGTAISVGWGITDILATAFEGISGKNILGSVLGWGEVIWPQNSTQKDAPSPKGQPADPAYRMAVADSNESPREAPTYSEPGISDAMRGKIDEYTQNVQGKYYGEEPELAGAGLNWQAVLSLPPTATTQEGGKK